MHIYIQIILMIFRNAVFVCGIFETQLFLADKNPNSIFCRILLFHHAILLQLSSHRQETGIRPSPALRRFDLHESRIGAADVPMLRPMSSRFGVPAEFLLQRRVSRERLGSRSSKVTRSNETPGPTTGLSEIFS